MPIEEFLLDVYKHLNALREARVRYASRLAPDFNVLASLGPDELRLSQIVKELLSPTGTHAQGSVFLRLFLERFNLAQQFLPHIDNVSATTEKPMDRLPNATRRMDIHLDFGGMAAIAIENKPRAGDQQEQCQDYLKQLGKSHPATHCVIYLSGAGNPPSETSLCKTNREQAENDGRFKILAYPQLIEWLKDCRRECQADRVSLFLSEFADYIQKQFAGIEMTEMQDVVNVALKDHKTLQAALEIGNATHEIRYHLLDRLEQQLRERLPDGWSLDWGLNRNNYLIRYTRFATIRCPEATLYSVCFEFENAQCAELIYGVAKSKENLDDLPLVRDCLNQRIAIDKSSPAWPWYWRFPAPYCAWATSVEPWLEIQDGTMADKIINKTKEIYDALRDAGLLHQLGGNAP